MNYDSRKDTWDHITKVSQLTFKIAKMIERRGYDHDASKLASPERELFDKYTPLLKNTTYGSDEYKQHLAEMGAALQHHYGNNSHHPDWAFRNEQWKDTHVFGDAYQISNIGRVKRKARTVIRKTQGNFEVQEKLLTPNITPKGYARIQLVYNSKHKNIFVHTLVCMSFYGQPSNPNNQVNHKNGNKLDNRLENLEWTTPVKNLQHSYDIGLRDGTNLKHVIHCVELDITTFGSTKMESALKERGYTKARTSSILAYMNTGKTSHLGLTFEGVSIAEHKEANSGINDMTLIDIIEMFCDWKAASLRHADGDFLESLEYNRKRFNISEQLHDIFLNTANALFPTLGKEKDEDQESSDI